MNISASLFSGTSVRTTRLLFSVVALMLCTIVLLLPTFSYPGSRQDEALLLVCPERILNGAIPNRDFQTLYGPGGYWLLAGLYRVFGFDVFIERVVGVSFRTLIVLAMFALASRWV